MKNIYLPSVFSARALLSVVAVALSMLHVHAQKGGATCGSTLEQQKRMLSPLQRKFYEAAHSKLLDHASARIVDEDVVYTIPVVVHVIEPRVGQTILTDAEINQGLMNANIALRNTAAESDGVDAKIQFQLAVRTPEDLATTGIRRIRADHLPAYVAGGAGDGGEPYDKIRGLDYWDNRLYYNVWVVSSLDQGLTSAMANLPPGRYDISDGTVIDADIFLSKVLVHELGHALGLAHTFAFKYLEGDADENTCPPNNDCTSDGDGVCDTEPSNASSKYLDCNGGATYVNPCTGATYGTVLKNYMSYSPDACTSQFTAGQVALMRNAVVTLRPALYNNLSLVPPPPLAVRLVSFQAERVEQNKVLLSWKTSFETGHDHFDIESSADAKSYHAIGEVTRPWQIVAGTREYLFTDQPIQNEVYYRLKQIDVDGSYAYSKTISVRMPRLDVTVSPNPAAETLYLGGVSGNWEVQVVTLGGMLLHRSENQSRIDVNSWPAGLYLVRVKSKAGEIAVRKIIKK